MVGRRLRRRAALELENLALRHQLYVLHRCMFFHRQRPGRPRLFAIDRLLWILLYPHLAALSGRDGVGQARHCRSMAPARLSLILALALEIGTAVSRS